MFQFEAIPGSKKIRGFFIIIYNPTKKIFSILDHVPLVFLPERIISLKNGGITKIGK